MDKKINIDILLDNLKDWGIEEYSINSDGSIDVLHSVFWDGELLTELPDLNIRKICGDFDISHNKLKSLKNCSKEIEGHFKCSNNILESLEYCPEIINGFFNCSHNRLESLEHGPESVKYLYDCSYNNLKSITVENSLIDLLDYSNNPLIVKINSI